MHLDGIDMTRTSGEGNPEMIEVGLSLIMAAHNLERIADHATNIAEDVIYLVEGVDVRHHVREEQQNLSFLL